MKKLGKFYLLALLILSISISCSDDNGNEEEPPPPPPPVTQPEVIEEIIESLEGIPDVDNFTEALKNTEGIDVENEELTVFAVKNQENEIRAVRSTSGIESDNVFNDDVVKRHIVEGFYDLSELKNNETWDLISITGDSLYVKKEGTTIYINGIIVISPEGVEAGKSVIYVVAEVIPSVKEEYIYLVSKIYEKKYEGSDAGNANGEEGGSSGTIRAINPNDYDELIYELKYDNNGLLTEVWSYEYSGKTRYKFTRYDNGEEVYLSKEGEEVAKFKYNSQGKLESYTYNLSGPAPAPGEGQIERLPNVIEFTWENNRITSMQDNSYYKNTSGEVKYYSTLTKLGYDSNNNYQNIYMYYAHNEEDEAEGEGPIGPEPNLNSDSFDWKFDWSEEGSFSYDSKPNFLQAFPLEFVIANEKGSGMYHDDILGVLMHHYWSANTFIGGTYKEVYYSQNYNGRRTVKYTYDQNSPNPYPIHFEVEDRTDHSEGGTPEGGYMIEYKRFRKTK